MNPPNTLEEMVSHFAHASSNADADGEAYLVVDPLKCHRPSRILLILDAYGALVSSQGWNWKLASPFLAGETLEPWQSWVSVWSGPVPRAMLKEMLG